MKTFLSVFVLMLTFNYIKSECCGTYRLDYKMKDGHKCTDVPGGYDYSLGSLDCQILVCYDGRWHEGTYCGKGSCNIFGCNCDGGCIRGPAEHPESPNQNFMQNYKDIVEKAYGGYSQELPENPETQQPDSKPDSKVDSKPETKSD